MKIQHVLTALALLSLTGCWAFNDKTTQGFTVDGVYDGDTYNKATYCSEAYFNSMLWISPRSNTLEHDPNSGSLGLLMDGHCFPGIGASGYARFDFVSPAPTPYDDWKNADGFTFAMDSNIPGLSVQPLLSVRKANGSVVKRKSTGPQEFFSLQGNGSGWQQLSYSHPPIADGEELLAVHIRVFVPHSSLIYFGGENAVYLDDVAPNRS